MCSAAAAAAVASEDEGSVGGSAAAAGSGSGSTSSGAGAAAAPAVAVAAGAAAGPSAAAAAAPPNLTDQIAELKRLQAEMLTARKVASKKLRNLERKRKRVQTKAKQLTDADRRARFFAPRCSGPCVTFL